MTAAVKVGYGIGLTLLVPALAVSFLAWNGAIAAPPALGLPDPGALTRFGLPVARALRDISATITIGALVLAAIAIPPGDRQRSSEVTGARAHVVAVAALAGFVWVWAGLGTLLLTYSDLAGLSPLAPGALQQLAYFATDFDLGRSLLISSTLAAVAAIGSMFTRRTTTVGILTVFALAALWPLALTGHATGASNHDVTVNAQFAHLVGVTVWMGGLVVLTLERRRLGDDFATVARRYSTMAGWAFTLVALSGALAAVLRVQNWSGLVSPYGALLTVKILALAALGVAGWIHRRRILPTLTTPAAGGQFAKLAALEFVVMGIAMGAAVALSRTSPPSSDEEPLTTAESLLGHRLPPPLGPTEWFTEWRIDTFWAPLTCLAIVAYLLGVARLRRRGDRWPLGRTIAWLIGSVMLIWATSAAPGVYGDVLFSMHMVQHMTIAIAVPTFLVMGAPITLALRTLTPRSDGSRGPREWMLVAVHSRFMSVVGHPVAAAALFVGSLVVFYYSPLFELSLRSHTAHLFMVLHFLITGYLFASVICGVDPGHSRPPYPFRMLLLMVTFGLHALFSVSLMSSTTILAGDWFSALDRTWGRSLAQDQYLGASIGWALGDYPLAILAGALIVSWFKADRREAEREERQAERDGDRRLREYNQHLQRLDQLTDRYPR